jgi:peptidoglycan/LPS O-acetylase OafA/YrhL
MPRDTMPRDVIPTTPAATFRIPCLDGIRAIAVLLVFIGHANLPTVVGAGTGVTIFFFLSGYLITTLLRREHEQTGRISLTDFYLRRALRILPPLYVFLAVAVALTLFSVVPGHITGTGIAAALLHYTNFVVLFGNSSLLIPGAGVLWSLAIEEHFYLIFPLLYLGIRRMSRKWQGAILAALCTLALAWRCVLVFALGDTYDRTYYGTDTRADALLLGCFLAVAANPVLDRVRLSLRQAYAVVVVGGLLVVAGEQLPDRLAASVGQTLQNVGLLLVFTAILSAPRSLFSRLLEWRPLARLGIWSYSFYLFHGIILTALEEHTGWAGPVRALVAFIITLALSHAVHVFVERPLGRWRRRLAHQRPAPAPEPAPAPA